MVFLFFPLLKDLFILLSDITSQPQNFPAFPSSTPTPTCSPSQTLSFSISRHKKAGPMDTNLMGHIKLNI